MPQNNSTRFGHLTDNELVQLIQGNQDYLGEVYKRCKKNSLFYLRRTATNSIDDGVLEDIFQDAIIALYENIIKGDFVLTVKMQTYIDKICYYILLKYIKANKPNIPLPINGGVIDTDYPESPEDSKEPKHIALEIAIEKMKAAGGHCYELLTLFWYHQKSIAELKETFGYTNDVNTRVQKSKCQERLRKLTFNEMNR